MGKPNQVSTSNTTSELAILAAQFNCTIKERDRLYTVFDVFSHGVAIDGKLRNTAKVVNEYFARKVAQGTTSVKPGATVDLTGLLPAERDAVVLKMMQSAS